MSNAKLHQHATSAKTKCHDFGILRWCYADQEQMEVYLPNGLATGESEGDVGQLSFESFFIRISREEKVLFIAFIKRMLSWVPEDRATAKQLLEDPWIHTNQQ